MAMSIDATVPEPGSHPAVGTGHEVRPTDIAVIGLACRYPGAGDHEEFWQNLIAGRDTVTRSPERVNAAGHTYIPARGLLERTEWFDAGFFGCSPREAGMLSPQHRIFLECATEALDHAGHDPKRHPGLIGVYAGGTDTGYDRNLRENRDALASVTDMEILLGTAPDYLASRVAYKLGLRGPAVTVQAACATSLVAVHTAIRALLASDCDMALAGGAAVRGPEKETPYTAGGIISQQGVCRTFDADADGTVGSDGAGVLVLRPLAAARADGDHVHAVLRGSAIGNDGPDRIGFTAPGVLGQARVVRDAQRAAETDPSTIGYVEAHGTATPLGDPIEVAALTRAFREGTGNAESGHTDGRDRPCWIGSVKSNIGHTDAAAGVASLIKTVLAVEHGLIPPTLHFTRANKQIDFAKTPFRVVERAEPWDSGPLPRRAGVSSFGIGGTNAHVVVQQAPAAPPAKPDDGSPQLLVLSARSFEALSATADRLAQHLSRHPDLPVADICWTLQGGRRVHRHRAFAVVYSTADAVAALTDARAARLVTSEMIQAKGFTKPKDTCSALTGIGGRWLNGEEPDWAELHRGAPRRRVVLPGYPFERQRYLVERASVGNILGPIASSLADSASAGAPARETQCARHSGTGTETNETQQQKNCGVGVAPTNPGAAEPAVAASASGLPSAAGRSEATTALDEDSVLDTVRQLFAEILGLPVVAPGDSFFDLGGDSLIATQLLSRIRETYDTEFDVLDVYDAQSPDELAALIEERHGVSAG